MKYTKPLTQKTFGEIAGRENGHSTLLNIQPAGAMQAATFLAANTPETDTLITDSQKINALTNRGGFLPSLDGLSRPYGIGKSLTVIGFDWIQYTGKKTEIFLSKKQDKFKINQSAAPFLKNIEICINGTWEPVATLWTELGAGIDKSWCMVKLDNKFCYQSGEGLTDLIKLLNHNLGIFFKNYNRLDIYCDIQQTDYRNFTPQDFMNKVAKRDYVFKGKKVKHFEGDRYITDNVDAPIDVEGRLHRVETIRVGKRKSGLSMTMYNKSAEMRAKGAKPWINETWKEAGYFGDIDTFRIEFSYMKTASTFVSVEKETGEVVEKLQHENLYCLHELNEMFRTLYSKHFNVGIYKKGERFSRLKPVVLLEMLNTFYIKTRLSDKQKNTNIIKANIRTTLKYCGEYENDTTGDNICHSAHVYQYVANIVDRHDLHLWFINNFPNIKLPEKIARKGEFISLHEANRLRLTGQDVFLTYGTSN